MPKTNTCRRIGTLGVLLMLAGAAAASTQEFLGVVESGAGAEAKVRTVTVFYVSHKVSPGTFEMFDPAANCVFMINDAFVTRAAFLRAVTPGKRLYCRGNRHRGQFYGLYTTPFFEADGIISKVAGTTAKVTHRQGYIMVTPATVTQTVKAEDGMLVRYEGRAASAAEALKAGRHVRVLKPRKQIVQVLTADVWVRGLDQIKAAYPLPEQNSYAHANEGFLDGYTDETYRFAAFGTDGLVDAEVPGPKTGEAHDFLLDGQYAPRSAALRCGRRTLFCPDQIVDHTRAYKVFQVARDDGTVEGVVKRHEGAQLVIETTVCTTGKAADSAKKDVTVALEPDAEYHLNGVVGFSADKKPDETTSFEYLRFTVLKGSGSLGRGVAEIQFLADGRDIGPGVKITGYKGAPLLMDGKTNDIVKWMSGRSATIEYDKPVAPTGFRMWTDGTGRGVQSFKVEGAKPSSGDGLNWVQLLHYDAGDGNEIPQRKWFELPINLSKVDAAPLTIDKALVAGSFVRVLPALPKGAILVRDVDDASTPRD